MERRAAGSLLSSKTRSIRVDEMDWADSGGGVFLWSQSGITKSRATFSPNTTYLLCFRAPCVMARRVGLELASFALARISYVTANALVVWHLASRVPLSSMPARLLEPS